MNARLPEQVAHLAERLEGLASSALAIPGGLMLAAGSPTELRTLARLARLLAADAAEAVAAAAAADEAAWIAAARPAPAPGLRLVWSREKESGR